MTNEEQEFYAKVGAFLRRVRESKGLNFQDVADALGVHKTFVQGYEAGRNKISLLRFWQVCIFLGIDLVKVGDDLSLKGFREL